MSLYETTTISVVTTVNNETKIALFTQPLRRYEVKTVESNDMQTIIKATEKFHAEVANAYGLFATTMTIYNNVNNVDELILRFEKLFKDSFSSEEQIKNIVSDIESQINKTYASSAPVYVSFWKRKEKQTISIYANIKFKMKDGYTEPILHNSQAGEFRDTVVELIKFYDTKHGNKNQSQSITLSGAELAEFGRYYADKVECETIDFLIKDGDNNWSEQKSILVGNYYQNGEFTIDDEEINGYICKESQAFIPVYNQFDPWSNQDPLDGDVEIELNLPIFKRYVQLTLEGKMFFGVQISKIESVTLELC